MALDRISDLSVGIAEARAGLDEYQRAAVANERGMMKLIISSRETIADSRDLLDLLDSPRDGRDRDRA